MGSILSQDFGDDYPRYEDINSLNSHKESVLHLILNQFKYDVMSVMRGRSIVLASTSDLSLFHNSR
jgi:hypothetical protein